MNPKALYNLTYGLYLLSTREEGKDYGCIINTAVQVARDPDRIAISVQNNNKTCEVLKRTELFNLTAITEDAPFDLFKQFGMQSARDVEKFRGYPGVDRAPNTLPILSRHGNMYLSVYVDQVMDLGSHTLFIGQILDGEVLSNKPSCSYGHYQANIKPKTKKAAAKQWECRICGHIYEGEEVPDDYLCPLCKHGKEDFVPVG
jgi:flavin reductase (DIM6/NTAB) family NADH-FMN oxidoreductase RutF